MIGSAVDNPDLFALIGFVWAAGGPSGVLVGQPITTPDGETYSIVWGDDEGDV
jgi:hypothetical protein